jgi:hypothetical protein
MGLRIINVKIFGSKDDASNAIQDWLDEFLEDFLLRNPGTRFIRFSNPRVIKKDDDQHCIVARLLVEAAERSISDDHITVEFEREVIRYINNMEFFTPPWSDEYVQITLDETRDYSERQIGEDIDSITQEALAQLKKIKNTKPFILHAEEETLKDLLIDWAIL